jgi:hypothetical protein
VLKPKSIPLFSNLFNFNTKIKFIFQQEVAGEEGGTAKSSWVTGFECAEA